MYKSRAKSRPPTRRRRARDPMRNGRGIPLAPLAGIPSASSLANECRSFYLRRHVRPKGGYTRGETYDRESKQRGIPGESEQSRRQYRQSPTSRSKSNKAKRNQAPAARPRWTRRPAKKSHAKAASPSRETASTWLRSAAKAARPFPRTASTWPRSAAKAAPPRAAPPRRRGSSGTEGSGY